MQDDHDATDRRKRSDPALALATLTNVSALTTTVALLERDVDDMKVNAARATVDSEKHREKINEKVDGLERRTGAVETKLDSLDGILRWILGIASSTFVLVLGGLIVFFVTHTK